MSTQSDLFSGPARARTTDPESSHAAAEQVEKTGNARTQRFRILFAVYHHPARNARELAPLAGLEYAAMSKRLSELHQRGLIDHGPERRPARKWFATRLGVEALGDGRWEG